jgi:hypothetical protein
VLGRAFPRIKALPIGPQLADHVAFGFTVAALLPIGPRNASDARPQRG